MDLEVEALEADYVADSGYVRQFFFEWLRVLNIEEFPLKKGLQPDLWVK